MKNRLSPAWIMGVLLAIPSILPVIGEHKVKRQLSAEPYPTYTSVPRTSFSCDLLGPGYYADMETQCQIFHICHADAMDSFICPEGTTFNQKVFVCDWWANVDCAASPDFYSLNSRIGSEEPFQTSPVGDATAWQAGGSTARTAGGSTERRGRTEGAPVGQLGIEGEDSPQTQLGSPSQARVKTVRPDIPGARRNKDDNAGKNDAKIGFSNTLLPNAFFVEEPTFVAKEVELAETSESPAESTTKPPSVSSRRQSVLSRRRGSEKSGKTQGYGTRLRQQGYLPTATPKTKTSSSRRSDSQDGYLPLEGSGEGSSVPERGGYLPLEDLSDDSSAEEKSTYLPRKKAKNAQSSRVRGSYLPEVRTEGSSSPSASYLPETGTKTTESDRRSGSNYLAEKPPRSDVPDASVLLPPPPAPEIPNGIEGAFVPPAVDEYSPAETTTAAPLLPPMNLLPLSNEPAPPVIDDRLPSTTESYGVLDEDEDEDEAGPSERPSAPTRSRQGFGRARRLRPKAANQGKNSIRGRGNSTKKPATEASPSAAAQQFQYDFDRVVSGLQERLRDVEPFNVPAAISTSSGGATVAPPSGTSTGSGVAPSPWLYSLARVPM